MKLNRITILLASVVMLCLSSCKKEDETVDFEYLTGKVNVSFPAFVKAGYSKAFMADTMSTLKRADGKTVGLYFKDTATQKADTVRKDGGSVVLEYVYTVPDTLGSFTLGLYGFSDHCYSSSGIASFSVVKSGFGEGCSLTGFDIRPDDEQMTDPRDGKKYYVAKIGSATWMRQNLAWEACGKPLSCCPAATDIFGMYYTWDEAQSVCPPGWRLPSEADWMALASACGVSAESGTDVNGIAGKLVEGICFNGNRMWPYTKDMIVTNSSRLSIMATGFALVDEGEYEFYDVRKYAALWTSDVKGEDGVYRYINSDRDILYCGSQSKTGFAASVRCVKE